jgi:threonine dehydratase
MGNAAITLAQIRDTSRLIGPYIVPTPVYSWRGPEISRLLAAGTEAIVKLELLQHTGTFKVRGALSQMLRLPSEDLRSGVTAVSAGNHAIAVAYVASILGVSAKVVMVKTANPARLAAARSHGAEILLAEDGATAFAKAEELVTREGRVFVHPFEGPNVTLGTATIGLELLEQGSALDAVLVAVGGGGLASGVATAVKLLHPSCRVYGIEPAGAPGMHRSFAAGRPQKLEKISTIADSLAPPLTLPYSFGVCRERVDELVTVDDDDLRRAMALIFRSLKFAVEPACAAVVAALTGPLRAALAGKRVGLIFCGSNIDLATFSDHVRSVLQ